MENADQLQIDERSKTLVISRALVELSEHLAAGKVVKNGEGAILDGAQIRELYVQIAIVEMLREGTLRPGVPDAAPLVTSV